MFLFIYIDFVIISLVEEASLSGTTYRAPPIIQLSRISSLSLLENSEMSRSAPHPFSASVRLPPPLSPRCCVVETFFSSPFWITIYRVTERHTDYLRERSWVSLREFRLSCNPLFLERALLKRIASFLPIGLRLRSDIAKFTI